jgi:hypothetical protein
MLEPNRSLGPYRIFSPLGSGGYLGPIALGSVTRIGSASAGYS